MSTSSGLGETNAEVRVEAGGVRDRSSEDPPQRHGGWDSCCVPPMAAISEESECCNRRQCIAAVRLVRPFGLLRQQGRFGGALGGTGPAGPLSYIY